VVGVVLERTDEVARGAMAYAPAPPDFVGGPAVVSVATGASPAACRLALAAGIALKLWYDEGETALFHAGKPPPVDVRVFAIAFLSSERQAQRLTGVAGGVPER
jgi:hypothetical protein